eukprot:13253127-Alexandrium_andersonii.AAC.1
MAMATTTATMGTQSTERQQLPPTAIEHMARPHATPKAFWQALQIAWSFGWNLYLNNYQLRVRGESGSKLRAVAPTLQW